MPTEDARDRVMNRATNREHLEGRREDGEVS